jgi:GNAT superfamily N-acetyltransferase
VFTRARRDDVRRQLLELARQDPQIPAAANTGSYAVDGGDAFSDIDLAFAITGDLTAALARWTELLRRDFGAVQHWDLPVDPSVYRVFLLADGLEVDIAFTPAADFGPRGPKWQLAFGAPEVIEHRPNPGGSDADRQRELIGLAWHHVLHARACIGRGKYWEAEWLIAGVREKVLALGCLRLGYSSSFARGADQLPAALSDPLRASLVRTLAPVELRRALAVTVAALLAEVDRTDPELALSLGPILTSGVAAEEPLRPDDRVATGTVRLGPSSAGELFSLQQAAYVSEARAAGTVEIPPLQEGVADLLARLADPAITTWGLYEHGRLLAAVRCSWLSAQVAFIGRLGVVPDLARQGLGGAMLRFVEARQPAGIRRIELVTGIRSLGNHAFYHRHGYTMVERDPVEGIVRFAKELSPTEATALGHLSER